MTTPTLAREQARTAVLVRSARSATSSALGVVAMVGVWFWGVMAALVAASYVMVRVWVDGTIVVPSGGPPQMFLAILSLSVAVPYLRMHLLAGGTRRSFLLGWGIAGLVSAVVFALITAALRVVLQAIPGPNPLAAVEVIGSIPVSLALEVLVGAAGWLAGAAIAVMYYRLGGWVGTAVLLVVVAGIVQLGATLAPALMEAEPDGQLGIGLLIALVALGAAGVAFWGLARDVPIRPVVAA